MPHNVFAGVPKWISASMIGGLVIIVLLLGALLFVKHPTKDAAITPAATATLIPSPTTIPGQSVSYNGVSFNYAGLAQTVTPATVAA